MTTPPTPPPNDWLDPEMCEALFDGLLDEDVAAAEQSALSSHALSPHALSPHVVAAARAAFVASGASESLTGLSNGHASERHVSERHVSERHANGVVSNGVVAATVRTEPLRFAPRAKLSLVRRGWVRAVAAVLVVTLASFALRGGQDKPAEAGISLRTLQRIDEAASVRSMPAIESGRVASMGEVFRAARHELLALEVDPASLYVLRDGDTLRVARCACEHLVGRLVDQGITIETSDVLFHLDAGEVRVAAARRPMPVWLPGVGLLVVTRGAAHVVADVGIVSKRVVSEGVTSSECVGSKGRARIASTPVPAVALAYDSEAIFVRATGDDTPIRLAAGERVLLTPDRVESFGRAAQSLFRELQFFGGVVPTPAQLIDVPARRWSVRGGQARLRSDGLRFETATPLQITWRVPPALHATRSLRLAMRGPAGLTVRIPALDVTGHVAQASDSTEPGAHFVTLALPANWTDALDGRPLLLEIFTAATAGNDPRKQAAPVWGWFDGAVLVVPSSTGRIDVRPAEVPLDDSVSGKSISGEQVGR